jgi:hypothetical protein
MNKEKLDKAPLAMCKSSDLILNLWEDSVGVVGRVVHNSFSL